MSWFKNLGKGLKKAGMTVEKALGSTVAIEILGTLAKDSGEIPDPVANGAKLALQLLILYRMANNNPDGTPSTAPFEGKTKTKGK